MKKAIFMFLFIAVLLPAFGQQDPKAKTILDKVSSKMKSYQTMTISFVYATENQQTKKKDSTEGNISVKAEKYRVKLMGNDIYFDGKTVTTHMLEVNEANITKPASEDDLFNPLKIITLYQKGFKYRFIEEVKEKGKILSVIDLYPQDIKKPIKYHRIRLKIDAVGDQIMSIRKFDKDGMIHTITVKDLKINPPLADKMFIFSKADHPGVEVIDMQ